MLYNNDFLKRKRFSEEQTCHCSSLYACEQVIITIIKHCINTQIPTTFQPFRKYSLLHMHLDWLVQGPLCFFQVGVRSPMIQIVWASFFHSVLLCFPPKCYRAKLVQQFLLQIASSDLSTEIFPSDNLRWVCGPATCCQQQQLYRSRSPRSQQ